jgi:hypothetical protein
MGRKRLAVAARFRSIAGSSRRLFDVTIVIIKKHIEIISLNTWQAPC